MGGAHSQRSLICSGRWWVEGEGRAVEDTRRSCIPIDTEEGFLLHPCKRRESRGGCGGAKGGGGGGKRASCFSDVESACGRDASVYTGGRREGHLLKREVLVSVSLDVEKKTKLIRTRKFSESCGCPALG